MSVPLFDVNAMVGRLPNEPAGGSVDTLSVSLTHAGVDEAVVSHVRAWQQDILVGNDLVLTDLEHRPGMHPCWVAAPDTCGELGGTSRFVSAAQDSGVVAMRLFPEDHGYRLPGPDMTELLAALAEAALPVLVDADQTSWDDIEAAAKQHPRLCLVACTVGYRTLRRIAGVLARTSNVALDLSYLGTHMAVEWLVERFGAQRMLFGTGTPRRDPADAVTRLLWSELDDQAVRAIGSDNLRGLLGMPGLGR
jgi:hypothetical protein